MVNMNCIGEVGKSAQLLYPYILLLNSWDALLHELSNLVLLHSLLFIQINWECHSSMEIKAIISNSKGR